MEILINLPIPEQNIFIYALIDPDTNQIRYIGQTTLGIERFKKHYKDFRPSKLSGKISKSKYWIKKLKNNNKIFKVEYLKYCLKEELNYWEKYYIAKYKHLDLLNLTEGGQAGLTRKLNDIERKEISSRTKAAMKRPDVWEKFMKNNIVPSHLGYKLNPEQKHKISNSSWHSKRKIQIIDDLGNIYESLIDAANKLNVTKQAIHRTINGLQKTCSGRILKRV